MEHCFQFDLKLFWFVCFVVYVFLFEFFVVVIGLLGHGCNKDPLWSQLKTSICFSILIEKKITFWKLFHRLTWNWDWIQDNRFVQNLLVCCVAHRIELLFIHFSKYMNFSLCARFPYQGDHVLGLSIPFIFWCNVNSLLQNIYESVIVVLQRLPLVLSK